MRRLGVLAGALLAALAAGSIAAATVNVHVGSYYFEDASVGDGKVVAEVGDQLRFLIDDNGGTKPHSVVVTELGIDSGPLIQGATYVTPVLDRPGTFTLFCRVHRVSFDHFTTLIVTGSAATPKPTPAPTATQPPSTATPPPTATQPSPTGGATAAPGSTAGPGGSPGPGGPGGSLAPGETVPPGSTPEPGESVIPGGASPLPSASGGEPLPPGVTGPPALTWLRSVLVGTLAMPGIAIVAALAWLLASRRRTGAGG